MGTPGALSIVGIIAAVEIVDTVGIVEAVETGRGESFSFSFNIKVAPEVDFRGGGNLFPLARWPDHQGRPLALPGQGPG